MEVHTWGFLENYSRVLMSFILAFYLKDQGFHIYANTSSEEEYSLLPLFEMLCTSAEEDSVMRY